MKAVAGLVGSEEDEHEEINFTFEAFPEAKLLTFLAMALKETIDYEFQVLQLELDSKGAEPVPQAPPTGKQQALPGDETFTAKAGGKGGKRARGRKGRRR